MCNRYQVMDFISVGMNAASVDNEFCVLYKRVTYESLFEISEESSYNVSIKSRL